MVQNMFVSRHFAKLMLHVRLSVGYVIITYVTMKEGKIFLIATFREFTKVCTIVVLTFIYSKS
jgi:hypothetical protein